MYVLKSASQARAKWTSSSLITPRSYMSTYNHPRCSWTEAEEGSANVLSTACTKWSGGYALTNGELRPFVRSAEGWLLRTE
jgi:hypothetical protein